MINKFILSISSDLDDPAYPQRILQEYRDFFHLERAHFASINPDGSLNIDHYLGWDDFFAIYKQYEEHDIWKPENMLVPQKAEAFNVDLKIYSDLSRINPLYEAMSKTFKPSSIISAIHPSESGICGFRLGSDIPEEKFQYHSIISPLISTCYFQHNKIQNTRDMAGFLGDTLFQSRLCAVINDRGRLIYSHAEFMNELNLRGLEWKSIQKQVNSFNRRDLMHIHSLKDRFTLPVESESTALTLEPVLSGGRLYCIIELHDKLAVPSITPREREVHYLLKQGRTNSDIAHALKISPETVKRHISNLFEKTGTKNRTELSHLVL